jgi:hypothetical protein
LARAGFTTGQLARAILTSDHGAVNMMSTLRKLAFVPILLLAFTACDQIGDPVAPLPSTADPLLGSLLGGNTVQGYTLVKDPILSLSGITSAVSTGSVIGFGGGTISLLGHTLTVPVGAVSSPTLFTMTVLPTGYVEVDLLATVNTLLGVLDLGSKGFIKPVPVTLTYARGTNVGTHTDLKVLRIKSILGYGTYEVMPSTVDTINKNVTAPLDHFSRYTLAYPAE